jgi:hypothetical protein
MRTILIRINDRTPGDSLGFPIELYEHESETGILSRLADASLPEDLVRSVAGFTGAPAQNGELRENRRFLRELLEGIPARARLAAYLGADCMAAAGTGQDDVHLRTYLDIQPPELRAVPWEMIVADEAASACDGHRIVRGCPERTARQERKGSSGSDRSGLAAPEDSRTNGAVAAQLPLRVLVVACRNRSEDEIDAVYAGLGRRHGLWQIEVLRQPSQDILTAKIKVFAPHVVHLIGAAFDGSTQSVELRRSRSQSWQFAIEGMAAHGPDSPPPPQLLVIDAEGALRVTLPERLRRRGTRAVLAIEPAVGAVRTAWRTRQLYERLAATGSIEEAAWGVREAIRAECGDQAWRTMPVLTVYGSPDNVLRPDLRILSQYAAELKRFRPRYDRTDQMADRIYEHMKVWGQQAGHPDSKVIFVAGEHGIGKSELIRSCMLTWELRGSRAILVDMRDDPRLDNFGIREALLHFCDKLMDRMDDLGLTPQVIEQVTGEIVALQDRLRPVGSNPDDAQFRDLCDILDLMADGRPLLLLLDHLYWKHSNAFHQIKDKLLAPISRVEGTRRLDHVYAIVAAGTEAFDPDSPEWPSASRILDGSVTRIDLQRFRSEDRRPIGREVGARKGWTGAGWRTLVKVVLEAQPNDWSPALLTKAVDLYAMTYSEAR